MNRHRQGISIVISAYKAQDFIEECLDSILRQKQWDFNRLEVVLGVDGCRETMDKLTEIQAKYTQLNLRVFWFKKNTGVYVTTNTLITLARFNNIMTFGADDYMLEYMVYKIMSEDERYNMIQFGLFNFDDSTKEIINNKLSEGCRFFTKELFMQVGGYMPWRHSADSEFVARTKPVVKQIRIREPLFMRRIHAGALTQTKKTCIGSKERQKYAKLSTKNADSNILVIPMKINSKYELRLVKEYHECPEDIVKRFMAENNIVDYQFSTSDKNSITDIFYHNYQTIVTYTSVIFSHKDLTIINKYYKIVSRKMINYKEIILWKRKK